MRPSPSSRVLAAALGAAMTLLPAAAAGATNEPPRNSSDGMDALSAPFVSVADVLAATLNDVQAAAVDPPHLAPRPSTTPSPTPSATPAASPEVFAHVSGVTLVDPTDDVRLRGFHEANAHQLTLEPAGRAVINDRGTSAPETTDGPPYAILASRGRAGTPTSAVNVAVYPDEAIKSVVTGTVVAANHYTLYGKVDDEIVVIKPDDNPDIRVLMLHIRALQVAAGDRVVAGETVVADHAHELPFDSQIDEHVPGHPPHVHVQVQPA